MLLDKLSVAESEETVKLWLRCAGNRDGGCYNSCSKTREEQQDETFCCFK